jgi:hypothetical protein
MAFRSDVWFLPIARDIEADPNVGFTIAHHLARGSIMKLLTEVLPTKNARVEAICSLLLSAIRIIESQLPCAVRLSSHNVCGGAGPRLSLA